MNTELNLDDTLRTILKSDLGDRDKSLLYIIALCGPKINELKYLKSEHIHADKNSLTIHFPKRAVRITNKAARFTISNWSTKVSIQSFGCHLFSSMKKNKELTGKPMSDVSINKILQKTFPGTNVRMFRRMFIDEVLKQDILKKDMKSQIGVSSYTALLHYSNENSKPQT